MKSIVSLFAAGYSTAKVAEQYALEQADVDAAIRYAMRKPERVWPRRRKRKR